VLESCTNYYVKIVIILYGMYYVAVSYVQFIDLNKMHIYYTYDIYMFIYSLTNMYKNVIGNIYVE